MPIPKGSPKVPGSGRASGTPNRSTKALKEAVLRAGDRAGGVDPDGRARGVEGWLLDLAADDPKAFAVMLGRLLPTESKTTTEGPTVVIRDYSGGKRPGQAVPVPVAVAELSPEPDDSEPGGGTERNESDVLQ
tara:strand:- start:1135 stop:1533 length:399 start_codon:yes stop_codon:yes gene_type:complete